MRSKPKAEPAKPQPTNNPMVLVTPSLPTQTVLVGFHGREALCRPYHFDVGLSIPQDVTFDMLASLGQRASLEVDRGGELPPFAIHGVISALELVAEYPTRSLFIATLVPQLWQLSLTHHSRVFTDGSIPEIIEAVLKDSEIPVGRFAFRLSSSYAKLEHVCQYQESNLAFISRLMEREGMYYFFEQGDSAELLVITDHRSFHGELGSGIIQFASWGDQQPQGGAEVVDRFKCKMTALPAQVRLNDYDYLNPSLSLGCSAPVATSSPGRIVLYGENYQTPDEGQRYAAIRAEEYLAEQAVNQGHGRAFNLRPGYSFQLEQHPRVAFNASYLTTELEHWGKQIEGVSELEELLDIKLDDVRRVELKAIAADVQYRARRVTPWPRVDGVVDGVVDGNATSPYAQIDEHGRYRVRIFFDESDLLDGSASTWVRMLQPHGGGTEGFHFPLRKETEVHIVFLGGDPDRPVITGVAPNAQKPSKVTTGNFTQNVIMTGGSNRMEFEDSDGSQYVDMSCPTKDTFIHFGSEAAGKQDGGFNLVTSTLGRWKQYSLADRFFKVESHSEEEITGYVKQSYADTLTTDVIAAVTETYHDTHNWVVDKPVSWHFKETFDETIDLAVSQTHNDTVTQTIQGPVTITIAKDVDETVDGATTYTTKEVEEVHDGDKSTTVTGAHAVEVVGPQTITSHTSQSIGAPTQTMAAETLQQFTAETHAVDAAALASTTAPAVTINGDGSVTITGGNITIAGGDVTITGGNLAIEHGPISVKGSVMSVDGGGQIDMAAGVIKLN